MEKEIIKLLNSTKKLKKAVKFTNNCYEIDNDIFCFENRLGDARYPYVVNGEAVHVNTFIASMLATILVPATYCFV